MCVYVVICVSCVGKHVCVCVYVCACVFVHVLLITNMKPFLAPEIGISILELR